MNTDSPIELIDRIAALIWCGHAPFDKLRESAKDYYRKRAMGIIAAMGDASARKDEVIADINLGDHGTSPANSSYMDLVNPCEISVKRPWDIDVLADEISYDPRKYPLHAAIEVVGIYPGAISGGDSPYEKRTPYMQGWNDAVMTITRNIEGINAAMLPVQESGTQWQLIETAPKYKLLILFAWHVDGSNWKMGVGSKGADDVWDWNGNRLDREWHLKPTHWQYLPKEPPFTDVEGGES